MPLPDIPYILKADAWAFIISENYAEMRSKLLNSGTLATDAPVTISQTWATTGTYTAFKVVANETATATAASNLLELWSGSTPALNFRVNKNGVAQFGSGSNRPVLFDANGGIGVNRADTSLSGALIYLGNNGTTSRITIVSGGTIGWSSSLGDVSGGNANPVTALNSDADNTLALRNGAAAQTFNIYGTSSSSNTVYERMFAKYNATDLAFQIGTETAGATLRPLDFVIGGTRRMMIGTTGNVGIGTNGAPVATLELRKDAAINGPMMIIRSNIRVAGNWASISFGDDTQATAYRKGALIYESTSTAANGKFHIALNNDGTTADATLADARLTVLPSGNVGIGTTAPTGVLDVRGANAASTAVQIGGTAANAGNIISLQGNATPGGAVQIYSNYYAAGPEGPLILGAYTNRANQLCLAINGNVGIGTTSPTSNLTVAQGTAGVGTISVGAAGTTVTGVGTQFLNTFQVGQTITSAGQTLTISAIASDTSMTISPAAVAQISGQPYTLVGGTRFLVSGNGTVGIGDTGTSLKQFVIAGQAISNSLYLSAPQYIGLNAPAIALMNGVVRSAMWDRFAGITLTASSYYGFNSHETDAGFTADTTLRRGGAANFHLGAADAAAPVAQTLSVQSVVAGTTNTAGVDFTIDGSQGTGTGAGGNLVFRTAPASGSSGSTQNALSTALVLTPTRHLLIGNISAGFSNTGLLAMGLALGTSGGNTGNVAGEQINMYASQAKVGEYIFGTRLKNNSSWQLEWSSTNAATGTTDTIISRGQDVANIQLGAADAATVVAQTLSVQSVIAGTLNTAGANFTIDGSQGTGTGAGGSILFRTAPASGSSGSTQNPFATALTITQAGNVGIGTTSPGSALHISGPLGTNTTTYDSAAALKLTNTTGNSSWLLTSGIVGVINASFSIRQEGSSLTALAISNVGNVGIGINTPTSKLHISGTIKPEQATITTNATTAILLDISHAGTVLTTSSSSNVTITLPAAGTVGVGYNVMIIQGASGTITVAQGAGNTLNSFGNLYTSAGLHAAICIVCTAANTYNISGNLA